MIDLEIELKHFQDELAAEEKKLHEFQELDVTKMSHEQLAARERGMKRVLKEIDEINGFINEIKEEMEGE